MDLRVHSRLLFALAAVMSLLLTSVAQANAQSGAAEEQYGGEGIREGVILTGTVEKYVATTHQYGTHGLVDEASGESYALTGGSTIDLDQYNGQRVTVAGTLVPGYENGQVENGPPLVEVGSVKPLDDGGSEGMTINGTVLEADGDSVLVEDRSGGRYDLDITADTGFTDGVVYAPEETPPRAPNALDLKPGLTVQVLTAGPINPSDPAQGEAADITFLSPWYEDGDSDGDLVQKTLSGYITSLDRGSVTVSEDPSLTAEDPEYCNAAIQFSIEDGTEIYATADGQTVPATAEDLAEGQRVDVAYTEDPNGVYPAICPAQRTSDAINILAGDPDNGNDDNEGGNSGDGSGDSGGAVASDSYDVLPDTGGPTLAGIAASVVVIAAGTYLVAVRRVARGR